MSSNPVNRDKFDAVLFDLDGVLTATAKMHAACWKKMFDAFLRSYGESIGEKLPPFEIESDYRLYVDGKPRFDGVRDFLRSRHIELSEGNPDDSRYEQTVFGLGNHKNELVNEAIQATGVEVYSSSIDWARKIKNEGFRLAVVTSSRNCSAVLESAGISDLFEVRVDGNVIHERNLNGKPAPDAFLFAAEQVGSLPDRTVVVEDAISGVQAGRAGRFGLVIGVARKGNSEELLANGADISVKDLGEFLS
ncbi:MAG: beta-phosphoglucomutase family hydrolase [Acidobacteriota bacterium]|jgi:beta-phosphoglucomutase family hydrolase